ncbi:DUF362 domain-containing protein [Desulfofundulus thermosubterraneus]|uniref:4Fe-4S binding domain-containing protein n=1 Tax=Desulfofundulus thermosubterraneus DSM 16057 TaxID=1121432 RepID=A0A1M6KN28_9FIRM|nr:4Fe-4S binding protein [Desulfofundulus thermosubterraneus]SHJ60274.1 4Fe-4S binding domain-containing protein [Desulfofundulus thermosubterraneus DSM 16057]
MLLEIGERCSGCGLCAPVCPTGALTMAGNKVVLSGECVACALCLDVCPVRALVLDVKPASRPETASETATKRRVKDDAQPQDTGV